MPRQTIRRPKPKFGQNFLISPTAPRAIADAMGDLNGSTVLEIGPGRGAITRLLAERCSSMIAVELDASLARSLQAEFADGRRAVRILNADILDVDLAELATQAGGRIKVVGNLPYYITSDILLHLFAHHAAIESAVLMVQSEVADRVVASPGGREYGLLSATAQMYARPERLFTLPPQAFSPAPKVYSTVFRLTMQPRFEDLNVEEKEFLHFLRQAFAQKRKTLTNNLRAAGYESDPIQAGLAEARIDPMIRTEAVPLETMARIYSKLKA